MLILGIETSCDETAASVVEDGKKILSNIISSQVDIHSKFGGVVPELASRKHIENILPVIEEALDKANTTLNEISAIAVTNGPGLVGSLLVGLCTSKSIAYAKNIPLIAINHLEAHIYATYLTHPALALPAIALIVSGGHTELIYVEKWGSYELMGRTLDDAVGESFDKVAKLLNLGYPGGPIIDKLAKKGDPKRVSFPRALLRNKNLNFSLSGLKTAVVYFLKTKEAQEVELNDLVASFQEAAIEVIVKKTLSAALEKDVDTIIVGGGVSANSRLRDLMKSQGQGLNIYFPSLPLCSDNGAMIAGLGYVKYMSHQFAQLSVNAEPNLKYQSWG